MKAHKFLFIFLALSALLLSSFSDMFIPLDRAAASVPTQDIPGGAPTTSQQSAAMAKSPSSLVPLSSFQDTFEQIYSLVDPSVVNIQVTQKQTLTSSLIPGLPFSFGLPSPQAQQVVSDSGFTWDTRGDIVTNYHVVSEASKIIVTFSDGTTATAQLIGVDPDSDLAVIKVNPPSNELHPVRLANSEKIKIGQVAIAIGNPFGLQGTMTEGIISGLGRSLPIDQGNALGATYTIPDIIQTDAPINPGNSGGVLVDDQGRLIGVTSAIVSPVQANSGIAFVIPSEIVQKVIPSLISTGHYEHPWLGITGTMLNTDLNHAMNLPPYQQGVLIIAVTPDSPADKAGLLGSDRQTTVNGQALPVGGDVVVAIDGHPVKTPGDLASFLALNTQVGQTVTLTILRHGTRQDMHLILGALPANPS